MGRKWGRAKYRTGDLAVDGLPDIYRKNMSTIVRAAGGLAVGTVALTGSATIIPLTPILILAGIAAGTVVAVSAFSGSKRRATKPEEIAKIQTSKGGDKFYVQTLAGDYCAAELDSDCRIACNRQYPQEREYFEVLRSNDGRFALRASNGRFVSVDRDKGGLLIANRERVEEWELFYIEERPGALVAFKASNGKYVSKRRDDHSLLKAIAPSIGESELFRITVGKDLVAMKNPIIITQKIVIQKTVEVKIDILNHEELAGDWLKEKYGPAGKIVSKTAWWLAPGSVKKKINSMVEELLKSELANIEERILTALPSKLDEEINKQFTVKNVQATVIIVVK
jgi:hypothetical protein